MSIKTQGTALYFTDPTGTPASVVKLKCPTGITGMGGPRDQIEDTCLEATVDKSFTAGLGTPGQVSVPFILDTQDASHQDLFDLKDAGTTLNWLVAMSDGTGAPTLNSNGAFDPPIGRSSIAFQGHIADVAIDIAGNEVVRGTLTIQRSGSVTLTPKE